MKTKRAATKHRGRPRGFDAAAALDAALEVFWRKGYEGATLPDLTEAMGINRPSLYAAFGNKSALFRKVLERYAEGPACYVKHAVEAPTGRKVFEKLLDGVIELVTCPEHPGGCLAVQGALACGDDAAPAREQLVALRAAGEALLRRRLEQAKADGDFPKKVNPADLARYAATVIHGIAVQGVSGASRRELRGVARLALAAWPAVR
jgi:AcrR family transcriptional regulator